VARDIRRIVSLWREMRARFGEGGPYLYGDWSVPDAFYTPVAARFRHFQIDLAAHGDEDGTAATYRDALLAQPDFLEWSAEALAGR
jgi:glutathione S-transferase